MPNSQAVILAAGKKADALVQIAGKDAQISQTSDNQVIITFPKDQKTGQISASAATALAALVSAGDVGSHSTFHSNS